MSGHASGTWIVNGKTGAGYRIDTIGGENLETGFAFIANPVAIVPKIENAQRIALCVNALAGVSDNDLVHLPDGHLARVMPITKGWREPEFESIGEMPDLAAILARRKGDA